MLPQTCCKSAECLCYCHTRDREAVTRKGTNIQSNFSKHALLKNSYYKAAPFSFPSVLFYDGQELQMIQPWKLSVTLPQLPLVLETQSKPSLYHKLRSFSTHLLCNDLSFAVVLFFSNEKDKWSCSFCSSSVCRDVTSTELTRAGIPWLFLP